MGVLVRHQKSLEASESREREGESSAVLGAEGDEGMGDMEIGRLLSYDLLFFAKVVY